MNANQERRPVLSGWCMSATGARPKCEGCRIEDCECGCHLQPVDVDLGASRSSAHSAFMNEPVLIGDVIPDVIALIEAHSPRPLSEAI